MHRILRAAAVFALLAAATACKKDLGPTDIDVSISATVAHLDHIKLAVRDQTVDKTAGYAYAYKDLPDPTSKTNPLDRDLTQKAVVVRLTETNILKGKPFLLYIEGYVTPDGATTEKLTVAGAITLQYEQHKTQQKKVVLSADFVANDKDHDGFRACGTYTASDDPEEQGFFSDAQYCDCNDANALINPFNDEVCGDGIDNNCTGWPYDEKCTECEQDLPCTNLSPNQWGLVGIGQCVAGHKACQTVTNPDGTTTKQLSDTCEGEVGPSQTELPSDGIDNDCDGIVDEGSPCNVTDPRACYLGQVGDAATNAVHGICAAGTQACVDGAWANACNGEKRPQRPPRDTDEQNNVLPQFWTGIGFYELEIPNPDPAKNLAQCDGIDNDCDGFIDEEPSFDVDADSYTICGTMDVPPANGTPRNHKNPDPATTPIFLQVPDLIDCDDSNSNVNPGEKEICNNGIDDDCRCDRGDFTGKFSTAAGGCGDQPYDNAQLICDTNRNLPYKTDVPSGFCDETGNGGPFYYGYSTTSVSGTQVQACFPCRGVYGASCDTGTGTCGAKDHDCAGCSTNPNFLFTGATGSAPGETRKFCSMQDPAACQGHTGPHWLSITPHTDGGTSGVPDGRDDCPGTSCAGYYADFTADGLFCRLQSDASATEVKCEGLPLCGEPGSPPAPGCCDKETGANCCEGTAEVCSRTHGDTDALPTQPPALCKRFVGTGCHGTTPPDTTNMDTGTDPYNQCHGGQSCAAHYDGFVTVTNISGVDYRICYPKADLTEATDVCNGGTCQDPNISCAAASNPRSATPAPRPTCQYPTGGCSGTTAPTNAFIPNGLDPYNECDTTASCDGAGHCAYPNGHACAGISDCISGHCADGVCCDQGCTGACEVCNSAAATGSCVARGADDDTECGLCHRCDGTTRATCQAQTGATGNGCNTGQSYCCGGNCVTPGVEYGTSCGSAADCTGGVWQCDGSGLNAQCSTAGRACGNCSGGDSTVNGTCSNDGNSCNAGAVECTACHKCVDHGNNADCSGTYADGSVDNTGSSGGNVCTAPSMCEAGTCLLGVGQGCSGNSQCANNQCVDGVCCNSSACGTCQTCNGTSPGSCTAVDRANDASCGGFCCAGNCVESGIGSWNASCGSGDCNTGHWNCSGTAGFCSSQGAACNGSCSGDTLTAPGSCDVNGNCSGGGGTSNCPVCSNCVDFGGDANCQILGFSVPDSTVPNQCDGSHTGGGGTGCNSTPCACDGGGSGPSHCQDF